MDVTDKLLDEYTYVCKRITVGITSNPTVGPLFKRRRFPKESYVTIVSDGCCISFLVLTIKNFS